MLNIIFCLEWRIFFIEYLLLLLTEEALNELYLNFPLELYTDVLSLMEKYIIIITIITIIIIVITATNNSFIHKKRGEGVLGD